jgi:plastocyanin
LVKTVTNGTVVYFGTATVGGTTVGVNYKLADGTTTTAANPLCLRVNAGDTIKWEGNFASHPLAGTALPFTVDAAGAGGGGIGIDTGAEVSYSFSAGSYGFFCTIPSQMRGAIFVGNQCSSAAAISISGALVALLALLALLF